MMGKSVESGWCVVDGLDGECLVMVGDGWWAGVGVGGWLLKFARITEGMRAPFSKCAERLGALE